MIGLTGQLTPATENTFCYAHISERRSTLNPGPGTQGSTRVSHQVVGGEGNYGKNLDWFPWERVCEAG